MKSSDHIHKSSKEGPVQLFLHVVSSILRRSRQGAKLIGHQFLLYFTITMYRHLFPDQYLYFLNIHDSTKTLKGICRYIAISQQIHIDELCAWQHCHRVARAQRNTYTGPVDVMLCAKPNEYMGLWRGIKLTSLRLLWLMMVLASLCSK